jgi:outer membrane immunogenic protein
MKKLVLAAAAATLISGSALAADLPTAKGPPPAPVAYVPAFTWTGFYVGINGGGAWQGSNNNSYYLYDPLYDPLVNGSAYPVLYASGGNRNGWMVGGTVGYNYQFGAGSGFVIGVEADLDYLSGNGKNRNAFYQCESLGCGGGLIDPTGDIVDFVPGYAGTYLAYGNRGSGNNYFGTLRLRAGYAFDRFLLYVTGGLAYGGTGSSGSGALGYWLPGNYAVGTTPDATFYVGRSSTNDWGWTIGAGAEYAITNNWTIKGEYLYVSRSGGNNNGVYAGCTDKYAGDICGQFGTGLAANAAYWYNTAKNDANMNIFRVGVNYKF